MSFDQQISCKNEGIPETKQKKRKEKQLKTLVTKKNTCLNLNHLPNLIPKHQKFRSNQQNLPKLTTKTPKKQKKHLKIYKKRRFPQESHTLLRSRRLLSDTKKLEGENLRKSLLDSQKGNHKGQ